MLLRVPSMYKDRKFEYQMDGRMDGFFAVNLTWYYWRQTTESRAIRARRYAHFNNRFASYIRYSISTRLSHQPMCKPNRGKESYRRGRDRIHTVESIESEREVVFGKSSHDFFLSPDDPWHSTNDWIDECIDRIIRRRQISPTTYLHPTPNINRSANHQWEREEVREYNQDKMWVKGSLQINIKQMVISNYTNLLDEWGGNM